MAGSAKAERAEVVEMMPQEWGPHAGPWAGPPGWIFPLMWLVVLAAVVTVVVLLRRRAEHRSGARAGEAVLAERYARGEIDADEYERRRGVLHNRRK